MTENHSFKKRVPREDTVPAFISPGEETFTAEEVREFMRLLLGTEGVLLDEDTSRRIGLPPAEEPG